MNVGQKPSRRNRIISMCSIHRDALSNIGNKRNFRATNIEDLKRQERHTKFTSSERRKTRTCSEDLTSAENNKAQPSIAMNDVDSDETICRMFHGPTGEFLDEIHDYLKKLENQFPIKQDFLKIQNEINARMRSILINWLTNVHLRFLQPTEVLYLTVSIMDRYLQLEDISRKDLQLVGLTAMFLAEKFEGTIKYCHSAEDYVYLSGNACVVDQLLKMERKILQALSFRLGYPLPCSFMKRNSFYSKLNQKTYLLTNYIMELSLVEIEFASVSPSLLAASALFLALKCLNGQKWSIRLEFITGYEETDLQDVTEKLRGICVRAATSQFEAVRVKYAKKKLLGVDCKAYFVNEAVEKR